MSGKSDYVREYYESYVTGEVDEEIKIVGSFLNEKVAGTTLDCGCGPVPQLWAIFMPRMTELYAIDLPQESVDFVKGEIADPAKWAANFSQYQRAAETICGKQKEDYILRQVQKIKDVQQADMTVSLPFPGRYFDTVLSLYSLGCLKNEDELNRAVMNIKKTLKPKGKLLHINTNGQNPNAVLPAYTWNGLSQASSTVEWALKKAGFENIEKRSIPLKSDIHGKYHYDVISLLSARSG